jgi:endonuclease I
MKKYILASFSILHFFLVQAQIPVGYYNSAQGLTGAALKTALKNIIDNHTVISYGNLWSKFLLTDKKPNGKVWDMYSDIPNGTPNGNPPYIYTFTSDQCGTYSVEGDCYNREHSWPKSWFNDPNESTPPGSDLFHIVPTDGKVNGLRSNFPYGEVNTAISTTLNGGKLGVCVSPGYAGVVFEPIDEYKGDFARGHFYMSTRYQGEDASWGTSPATNKSTLLPWQVNLLISWHNQDPVSAKEIARNNAIYNIQNNRNPYIDNPQWVDSVWSPNLSATAQVLNNLCFGNATGSITVNPVYGQSPYTFTWLNSSNTTNTLSNLAVGTYTCTITDALDSTFVVVKNVTQPSSAVSATGIVNNGLGNVTLTTLGGFGPYTYLWSNGATTKDLFATPNGLYTVTITDVNGCTFVTSFVIDSNADLSKTEIVESNIVYPNPANINFEIKLDAAISSVTVYNYVGEMIYHAQDVNATSTVISSEKWSSGLYYVETTSGDKLFLSKLVRL